jgi:hypothetical protein
MIFLVFIIISVICFTKFHINIPHLLLDRPNALSVSDILTKLSYAFFIFPVSVACPYHTLRVNVIAVFTRYLLRIVKSSHLLLPSSCLWTPPLATNTHTHTVLSERLEVRKQIRILPDLDNFIRMLLWPQDVCLQHNEDLTNFLVPSKQLNACELWCHYRVLCLLELLVSMAFFFANAMDTCLLSGG